MRHFAMGSCLISGIPLVNAQGTDLVTLFGFSNARMSVKTLKDLGHQGLSTCILKPALVSIPV
jgi:hypothetical protein